MKFLHNDLTSLIIGAFYRVYNTLGYGFLEKAYENALIMEFIEERINFKQQSPISVFYKGKVVGKYCADIIVEDKIILEIKTLECLNEIHETQLVNYLKATSCEIGLLLNFGPTATIKRKILTNNLKTLPGKNT